MMKSAIYSIKNIKTGKLYIGSAVNVKRRWQEHRTGLRGKCHRNGRLQNAWLKYGEDSFDFVILEQINDVSLLIEREQYWMDAMKSADKKVGYNICPIAGNALGTKRTPETKAKLSRLATGNRRKGVKRPPRSPEWSKRISEGQKGKVLSPEHKANISAGLRASASYAASNIAKRGKPVSDETRAKMSLSHTGMRGQKRSTESKEKMSAWQRGKKYPDRVISEETREKLRAPRPKTSVAMKKYWESRKTLNI